MRALHGEVDLMVNGSYNYPIFHIMYATNDDVSTGDCNELDD